MNEMTAIIKKIKIGKVDYYTELMVSCTMDMDGAGCVLTFSIPQIKQMMEDCNIYDDVFSLVGKPCQIKGGWGERCEFIRMWKA